MDVAYDEEASEQELNSTFLAHCFFISTTLPKKATEEKKETVSHIYSLRLLVHIIRFTHRMRVFIKKISIPLHLLMWIGMPIYLVFSIHLYVQYRNVS